MADFKGYTGVQIKTYHGPDWYTKCGVRLKQKYIEKKGIPPYKYCKFITLTVPDSFCSPKEAYKKGKDRLRRFLHKFRQAIGRKFAWAWKLEFQENGYPHWHLIIDYKKKIPSDFLYLFTQWWGLGRVNVKGLKKKDFNYLFKYVSKQATADYDEDCELALPSWVLDYKKRNADGRMSAGIRFWQTGGGFYINKYKPKESEDTEETKEQRSSRVPYTIRERWRMYLRKFTVFVKNADEQYLWSRQIYFKRPFAAVLNKIVMEVLSGKAAPAGDSHGYVCRFKLIEEEIEEWIIKTLHPLQDLQLRQGMVYFSAD